RRVQMGSIVRYELDTLDRPRFLIGQIGPREAWEKSGHFLRGGLMVYVLDPGTIDFRIRNNVVLEVNRQVDYLASHDYNASRSAPFSPSNSRASAGVAGSWPISCKMRRILRTCSALETASLPLSMNRLSSSPTRTFPPSKAAW